MNWGIRGRMRREWETLTREIQSASQAPMARAGLVLLVALLLAPRATDAACAPSDLRGKLATRCTQAHLAAAVRCLRKGIPLRDCAAAVRSDACDRLPAACRPAEAVWAVLGAALDAGPRDRCRARMARVGLRLAKRGVARGRQAALRNLPADLAACRAQVLDRCAAVPALGGPCRGLATGEDAAACLCGLALPVLPATLAFANAPCPSRFAGASCPAAGAPAEACHEAFADDFCIAEPGRAAFTPAGTARAWSFPLRPRARAFHGAFPEATGSVRARSDGLGPVGAVVGASSEGHLRLAAPILTSRILLLRAFTADLPDGTTARVQATAGTRLLADLAPPSGGAAGDERAVLVSWQGDVDVAVAALASARRDVAASADVAWRLALLDPAADDDGDGLPNARDPAPLDPARPVALPPSRPRVLHVALDGAGWDVLDPLIDAGYLPTIGALVRGGARAALDETPSGPGCCFCPPIWSTQATGEPASLHRMHLIESEPFDRPVPALWNVLAAHGGTTTLASYRNAFPSETGVTYNLTEPGVAMASLEVFAAQQGFVTDDGEDRLERTWPPLLFETLGILPWTGPRPQAWLPFAVDRTSAEALARLAATAPTDLTMWLLHSVDKSEHLMWGTVQQFPGTPIDVAALLEQAARWSGPVTGGCCGLYVGFAWGDVASQYLEAEQHVSRLLAAASHDYVLLTSDHAMTANDRSGGLPGIHSTPPAFNGIFALSGPGVAPGRDLGTVSVLDVTPTLAYLLDLPVADDLPGDVVTGAFTDAHLTERPIRRVATWRVP